MNIRVNSLFFLVIAALFSIWISLSKGSTFISNEQLFAVFTGKNAPFLQQIIFSLRLPRTLSAFVTGGLLALAGTLMQILLRNPLADPYILGISGGAALATMLLMLAGVTGLALLSGGAWLGSLTAIILVFVLSSRNQIWNTQHVLLTGVALTSAFSALISLVLIISPDHELRGMLFWLMGDLSYAHLPVFEALLLLLGLIVSMAFGRELNILLRGDQQAKTLGVNTERLQLILYLLASALTAAAVTLAGCIGFVGLIVPHALRLLGLHDQRFLLPAAVLLGGTVLTLADTLARTLFSPQQLPVGLIMGILGIPVFLILLQRNSAPTS